MFKPDWLILCVTHQPFEIEGSKGHYSDVLVHLYRLTNNKDVYNIV